MIAHHWPGGAFFTAKTGAGGFVRYDLDCAEQANAPCFAYQRVIVERGESLCEIGPCFIAGALDQPLTLHNLDITQSHC